MKKIIALIFALIFALSLTSCTVVKTGSKDDNDKKEDTAKTTAVDSADKKDEKNEKNENDDGVVYNGEKPSASVNYSKVLKKLNSKQKKFVDDLGESKKKEKLVAYFGNETETQVIVADFKDNRISKVSNYRFPEIKAQCDFYEAYSKKKDATLKYYSDVKCVEIDETRRYSGKSYNEMVQLLSKYDFK